MKITRRQLRRIISEAVSKTDTDTMDDIIKELTNSVKMHQSQADRLQAILDRLIGSEDKNQ